MGNLTLQDIQARVLTCTNCGLSCDCRSPIPVAINPHHSPSYIVVGEAPGKVEDAEGEAFVGPAGKFLKRALRKANLSPLDGAWMNAVSCFPKKEKTPTSDEISACKINLFSQLNVIDAKFVLVCGAIAIKALMPHAQIMWASGAPVVIHHKILFPVYHPAYILRQRSALNGWERDLDMFSTMVHWGYPPSWQELKRIHCLYCNHMTSQNSYTCPQHAKWFAEDAVVRMPKPKAPPQPQLF